MIDTNTTLFQRLQDIREDLDLTQQKIAKLLNVAQPTYSRWENGLELIPIRKLNNFCNITNHSMDYVTGLITFERATCKQNYTLDPNTIGRNLKTIRMEHGLFQHQLAKLLNTTQSTISAYENGETLILTAFAYQIAKHFHVSLDRLCGRIPIKKKISS
ncbi:MAG: helix-turn-helix transcriptional regulator [Bacilli bacterium]|nr:helix-turn-helix transcriptional regulator [Bacilli bacterium]